MFVARAVVAGVTPMGMNLSSNFSASAGDTNKQITSWSARTGYSGTVIAGSKLVVSGSGSVTAHVLVTLTSNYIGGIGYPVTIALMQNATSVTTATIPNGSSSCTITQALTVANSDTVWLTESIPSSSGPATIASGSTSTYLYFA